MNGKSQREGLGHGGGVRGGMKGKWMTRMGDERMAEGKG